MIHNPTCAKFANGKECPSHKEGKCCFPHRKDVKGKGPSKPSSASLVAKKAVANHKKKGTCAKGAVVMDIGSAEGGDDEE